MTVFFRRKRPVQVDVPFAAAIQRVRRALRKGGLVLRADRSAADSWAVVDERLKCVVHDGVTIEHLGRELGVLQSVAR